jgi:hypothetical protein
MCEFWTAGKPGALSTGTEKLPILAGAVGLALFESDGGAWSIDAMHVVKTWLENALKAKCVRFQLSLEEVGI